MMKVAIPLLQLMPSLHHRRSKVKQQPQLALVELSPQPHQGLALVTSRAVATTSPRTSISRAEATSTGGGTKSTTTTSGQQNNRKAGAC
jgi:hypothetical protein